MTLSMALSRVDRRFSLTRRFVILVLALFGAAGCASTPNTGNSTSTNSGGPVCPRGPGTLPATADRYCQLLARARQSDVAAAHQPPAWSADLGLVDTDVVEWLDDTRLLVGRYTWGKVLRMPVRFARYRNAFVFDTTSGRKLYELPRNSVIRTDVLLSGENAVLMHVSKKDQYLESIETATGAVRWRQNLPYGALIRVDPLSREIILGEPSGESALELTMLDAESGKRQWSVEPGGTLRAGDSWLDLLVTPNRIVVRSEEIFALHRRTGREVWRRTDLYDIAEPSMTSLVLSGAAVLFREPQGIHVLDPRDGSTRWSRASSTLMPESGMAWFGYGSVLAHADAMAVLAYHSREPEGTSHTSRYLVFLDWETGRIIEANILPRELTAYTADRSSMFFVHSDGVEAFNVATGARRWFLTLAEAGLSPVPDDNLYGGYVLSVDGSVLSIAGINGVSTLDATTGKVLSAVTGDLPQLELSDARFPAFWQQVDQRNAALRYQAELGYRAALATTNSEMSFADAIDAGAEIFVASMQDQAEAAQARRQERESREGVRARSGSAYGNLAVQSISTNIATSRMNATFARNQAIRDLGQSMAALGDALGQAAFAEADRMGKVTRPILLAQVKNFEIRPTRFLVSSFDRDEVRWLRVIRLADGAVAEFPAAGSMEPQQSIVHKLTMTLSPDDSLLLIEGFSLDPAARPVAFKTSANGFEPGLSLIAYELESLDYKPRQVITSQSSMP